MLFGDTMGHVWACVGMCTGEDEEGEVEGIEVELAEAADEKGRLEGEGVIVPARVSSTLLCGNGNVNTAVW